MSARTYNWLFALWLFISIVRAATGGSDAAIIGSLIIAFMCSATADILDALAIPSKDTNARAAT